MKSKKSKPSSRSDLPVRCGDCKDLKVLSTGSQLFMVCLKTKRTKTSYFDECDIPLSLG